MVEGIPLCVFEAVLQLEEGVPGPGGDGPLCGLCLLTEGGVCCGKEKGWGRGTALFACLMLEYTCSRVFSPLVGHFTYWWNFGKLLLTH